MSGQELLKVDSVCRDFGRFRALTEINLTLAQGEFRGLIGPNGSGKTTFFNVISGVNPATSGRVFLRGREITRLTPDLICRAGLARTFQIPRPFKEMTILENVLVGVLFGREGRSLGDVQAADKARGWLEFVGLEADPQATPKELTAGNLRRLEMARTLATGPDLFLADEIMGGLNQQEIDQTCQVLRRIHRELKVTVIWIEHIMGALMNLVERVTVLDYGVVIAEGAPEAIARDERVIEAYLGRD